MVEMNVDLWNMLQAIEQQDYHVQRHGNNRFTITSPDGKTSLEYNANGRPDLAVRRLAQLMKQEFAYTDTVIRDGDDLETRFKKLEAARQLERMADPDWDPSCIQVAEDQARSQLANNKITITFEYVGPWEAFLLLDAHEKARIARGLSEDAELDIRAVLEGEPFIRQRKVSKIHKANLGQILRLGHFMLTHQGIAVAEDGYLLDGQHRVKTIVEEGLPAALPIARNVPNEVFPVIDTGKKRTGADILGMAGVANANHVQSAIRILYWYDNEPDWKKWFSRTLSEKEILDLLVNDYTTVGESVNLAKRATNGGNLKIQPAVTSAVAHIVLRADPRAPIEQFWSTAAGSGANDPIWYDIYGPTHIEECPAFALRRWAANWSRRPGKGNNRGQRHTEHLICSIRSYNEAIQGNRHKTVVFKETYAVPQPMVLGSIGR